MLEEAGEGQVSPPWEKRKKEKKRSPSFLARPEKTELELEHPPHQADPHTTTRSRGAAALPLRLAFRAWPPREEGRGQETETGRGAGGSAASGGLRRQHRNGEGRSSHERRGGGGPPRFLVGCGFRTSISTSAGQDRGRSHGDTVAPFY